MAGPVTYTDAHGATVKGEYQPASPDPAHPHTPIEYPEWRAFFGDSATLDVDTVIDEKGNVISAVVDKPTGKSFDRAAIDAIMTWHYLPATVGGRPAKDISAVQIKFVPPPGYPAAPDEASPVFGVGQRRCSAWTEHRNDGGRDQYVQWLLGFFSGISSDVGQDSSEQGLTRRMDVFCGAHPLESISSAARQMVIEQVHSAESLKQEQEWLKNFDLANSNQKTGP